MERILFHTRIYERPLLRTDVDRFMVLVLCLLSNYALYLYQVYENIFPSFKLRADTISIVNGVCPLKERIAPGGLICTEA